MGWTNEVGLLAGTRADAASLNAVLAETKATILAMRREADAKLLGCISVEPLGGAHWYISLLAIDPEQQASGYGGHLLAEAERFVHSRGARTAGMTVILQRKTLIAWYERHGYRRTGAPPISAHALLMGISLLPLLRGRSCRITRGYSF